MTPDKRSGPVTTRAAGNTTNLSATLTEQADTHAWSGIFLDDGRVISIAWLRGYRGAVTGRWSRG